MTDSADPVGPELKGAEVETTARALEKTRAPLTVLTWNMCSMMKNPFEYWITHPDPAYWKLMVDAENFVETPGVNDVMIGDVFTRKMFDELDTLMTQQGWPQAEECRAKYASLAERTIIMGFLKDERMHAKRLVSFPDRLVHTLDLLDGGRSYRPCVITGFAGDMTTLDKWWSLWKQWMFVERLQLLDPKRESEGAASRSCSSVLPCELLYKIPRQKYPALTEEEEAMSLRLQTVCMAIWDAILIHMLITLSPDGKWLELKRSILDELVVKKQAKTLGVLTGAHGGTQVMLLQEVRTTAVTYDLTASLPDYVVAGPSTHGPSRPSKNDQNSVVALRKDTFDEASVTDVTAQVYALMPADTTAPSDGDLLAVTATHRASGKPYLFASYHGDTDGLATAAALHALHALSTKLPGHALVLGLDANTYDPKKVRKGKQACAAQFLADVQSKQLGATFGSELVFTAFNARTYVQAQPRKACRASEMKGPNGDHNPKDWILYSVEDFDVVCTGVDNTGQKQFDPELVLPTLVWPSDHSLVFSSLSTREKPTG